MLPKQRPVRYSARLRDLANKRRRLHSQRDTEAQKMLAITPQQQDESCKKTTILSLPDEPLLLIMTYLKASDTSGSFQVPRHAFALALTNTRLLSIFGQKICVIAPDLSNTTPPTLSTPHILSVCRIAGSNLRQIRLGACYDNTLANLALACPHLKVLFFQDSRRLSKDGLADLLALPLDKLSVDRPTEECLEGLQPQPRELGLFNVSEDLYNSLIDMLMCPPKILRLSINSRPRDRDYKAKFCMLQIYLAHALPKMRALSVEPTYEEEDGTVHGFEDEAYRLVRKVRENTRHSICDSIKVTSYMFYHLLSYVDSSAEVEVSTCSRSYIGSGDQIYARKLVLTERFSQTNVSRLEEVEIMPRCNPLWGEVLENVKLKRMFVLDVEEANYLHLKADIIELPVDIIRDNREWSWLAEARKLRLYGVEGLSFRKIQQLNFFRGLTSMLRFFRGRVLWISSMDPSCFTSNCRDRRTLGAVRALINALNRFEAEDDKDAGTVQAMIDVALTHWSLERSDL